MENNVFDRITETEDGLFMFDGMEGKWRSKGQAAVALLLNVANDRLENLSESRQGWVHRHCYSAFYDSKQDMPSLSLVDDALESLATTTPNRPITSGDIQILMDLCHASGSDFDSSEGAIDYDCPDGNAVEFIIGDAWNRIIRDGETRVCWRVNFKDQTIEEMIYMGNYAGIAIEGRDDTQSNGYARIRSKILDLVAYSDWEFSSDCYS